MELPWTNITLTHPWFLLLLLLIPLAIFWHRYRRKQRHLNLTLSNLESISGAKSWRNYLQWLLPLLSIAAFCSLIIALARPQLSLKEEEIKANGIDIMLVLDLSSSMLAQDFKPDRLEVAKLVAQDFVDKRKHDRLGLAVFAGESYTQCPLTTDHAILKGFMSSLTTGILEDGTAIGMGLASAVNRLKDTESKSKVIILLTDGVNNAGYIKPMTAAEVAKEMGVKVYTIGVGSTGDALTPITRRSDGRYVFGLARVNIDEDLLREIASMTGGKYYRATTERKLEEVYNEIDQLEKTVIEVTTIKRHSEEFTLFAFFALICLLLRFLLSNTILRSLP